MGEAHLSSPAAVWRLARSSVTTLLVTAAANGQTFVVNPAGGGDFRTILEASPLVPSGATLRVRPGIQPYFSVQNKSLKILADGGCNVWNARAITVGPTSATDTVVIDNLNVVGSGDGGKGDLIVQDAKGPVVLRSCTVGVASNFYNNPVLVVMRSPNVHVFNCSFTSDYYSAAVPRASIVDSAVEMNLCTLVGTAGIDGYRSPILGWQKAEVPSAAVKVSNAWLTLVDCLVTAGQGGNERGVGSPNPAANGGAGISAVGATVHVYGAVTAIRGGAGGDSLQNPGGAGGPGIELSGSAYAAYDPARVSGGAAGLGIPAGTPGARIVLDATSQSQQLTQPAPVLIMYGTPPPNFGFGADLRAAPGSVAALLIGRRPLFLPAPPLLSLGALCVDPALAFSGFVVPSSGALSMHVPLPHSFPPYEMVAAQYAVLAAGQGSIWMSNSGQFLNR